MTTSFATGRYAAAAIRNRPRADTEMTSQLLFGEPVRVLQQNGPFSRIRCGDDDFEGFIRTDQLQPVSEEAYLTLLEHPAFNLDLFSVILGENMGLPITFGARLPAFDGLRLQHGGQPFSYSGQAAHSADLKTDAELCVRLARKWRYVPGLAGGRTPTGIGAAALVQLICRMVNIRLPREAKHMVYEGRLVDFVVQAQLGDLAYFDNRKGEINHVGILLPNSQIIHVYDRVRIDAVDHFGIFNAETGRYTHRLRVVKRLFPDDDAPGILMSKKERLASDENQIAIF